MTESQPTRIGVDVPVVGAAEPFDRFYEREYRPVVTLAYVLAGSPTAAEDVAQDAFVAALRDWERVSRHPNPEAWIRRVAANRSVSSWRRRTAEIKALRRLVGWTPPPIETMSPEASEVWREVRKLPRRQAQAVALRYLEDLSVDQIAEILECSDGAVKQHLHRARRTLAHHLGEEKHDER
jgi:RNA polymerase sigma-70 factor (ECF subfamily)